MTETSSPDSSREFLTNIELLLSPVYAECFSDETRKTKNLLLIVSSLLILSTLGLVAFKQELPALPVLQLPITITSGIRWVLVTLCGYLLVLHSTRAYPEWNLWRLRHQAPMMQLSELNAQISSLLTERYANIYNVWKSITELSERLDKLQKDPPELLEIIAREKELLEKYQSSGEFEIFEESNRLHDEINQHRDKHKKKIAFERDTLERQLRNAHQTFDAAIDDPIFKALKGKLLYLDEASRPARRILTMRFRFEVLFPTAFAVTALLMGIFPHKSSGPPPQGVRTKADTVTIQPATRR
jgi:hypothetical protein